MSRFDKTAVSALQDQPTISIVVPAYNVAPWVDEAITSALYQDPSPHEVIIVNDGSVDNTGEILRAYERHPLVRIITQENRGLGSARNVGLSMCTGQYVYFMDSDDVIDPSFMSRISDVIKGNQFPDLVLFAGAAFADDGRSVDALPTFPRQEGKFPESGSLLRTLIDQKCLHALATLYVSKRQLWQELQLTFPSIIHEDEAVVFQLLTGAKTAVVITDFLYRYRLRAASIMSEGSTHKTIEATRKITQTFVEEVSKRARRSDPLIDLWRWRGTYWAQKHLRTVRALRAHLDWKLAARATISFRSVSLAKEFLWSMIPRPIYSAGIRTREAIRGFRRAV